MAILDLISHVHLPSFVNMLPKYLKHSTFSNCFCSIIIATGDGCLEILITFVFSTFISMPQHLSISISLSYYLTPRKKFTNTTRTTRTTTVTTRSNVKSQNTGHEICGLVLKCKFSVFFKTPKPHVMDHLSTLTDLRYNHHEPHASGQHIISFTIRSRSTRKRYECA